ncbi:MAG TPA: hypothetical protein VJQ25_06500 [Nitrospira sp.]|nr:hypothetical protein [Nitrospira sp.]
MDDTKLEAAMHGVQVMSVIEEQTRHLIYAEISEMLNNHADIWEEDGSDPCRVRICREWANVYRTYAEGVGVPSIVTLRKNRDKARASIERVKILCSQTNNRVVNGRTAVFVTDVLKAIEGDS